MAKEDLLSKQINELGFVLRRILEKLVNANSADAIAETVSEVNFRFNETLNSDLKEIEKLPNNEVIPFLLQYESFNTENLELFADILFEINIDDFAKKAVMIYEYIDIKTATFSMERNRKIQIIKNRLF